MRSRILALVVVCLVNFWGTRLYGAIVFEDFNTNEGRFTLQPTFSPALNMEALTSTADRVTGANPRLEGAGAERLVFDVTTGGSASRVRFLSGGGDRNGASGAPANTPFTLSAGVDGFIGFYLMSPVSNTSTWTATIALDGPGNITAEMTQGVPINIINDGVWRPYEWNLDTPALWQTVTSIGGNATLENGTASIDSLIFRSAAGQDSTFYVDFIAKSDSGTIANLVAVPEPGTFLLLAFGGACAFVHHRRKM